MADSKHKGRLTIRPGASSDIRNGRPNKRIRPWDFEAAPGTTMAQLEAAHLDSQNAVDDVLAFGAEAAKSGKYTEAGLKQAVLDFVLNKQVTRFKRGRDAITRAKQDAAALEAQIKLGAPDTSDPWKVGLMLRAIDHVKSLSQEDRDKLTRNPSALDPVVAEALISAPAGLTGISEVHRAELVKRALDAQHGDKIAELEKLKAGIAAAESAVSAGHDEIRLEAGVFDHQKFNEMAAPFEAKASAPWLKKSIEGGTEIVRRVNMETKTMTKATPDEIERGVFAKDWDEYNKLTGKPVDNRAA